MRAWLFMAALAIAACGGGSETTPGQPDARMTGGNPDAGTGAITLEAWVDDLVDHHTTNTDNPDTVDDKVIIDTDQTAPFDRFLQ